MKLSKAERKELDNYANTISGLYQDLDNACDDYNGMEVKDNTVIEGLIVQYNEAMDSAKGWCESIAENIQSFMDEKSEGWQEGDNGEAHQTWKESFEDVDVEPISFDMIEMDGKVSMQDIEDFSETLLGLSVEPDL